ncbi:hypothetical protein EV175_002578 [Coemansia sp. RSA 1933]|nr:hypothetical protein EV175_002578 [Coemansia sp. RSA 1933]
MNQARRRPAQYASTIGTDYSVGYPCGFTALSISPYGRDVVLAGREGLAVIDLEFPLAPPRTVVMSSLWKIANVAWCPSTAHHGWVGTAVNQTLVIHDLAHSTEKPMRVMKAHPMAITDIAWVPRIPSWIGTASIDPVIKIWDARRDQKPVWYYSEWEPADLLAFNNVHMHKLASVHRTKVALWDIRFGSSPLMTMDEAHVDNITSIAWHPTREDTLVSASQDGTVKRWSVDQNSPVEEYCHSFPYEVLGVSYVPFGEGLLVTQRSPDNRVAIVRDDAHTGGMPTHEFVGHTGAVHGTAWRSYSEGPEGSSSCTDHQLVTWGQDRVLRLWAVDDHVIESVGGKLGTAVRDQAAESMDDNKLGAGVRNRYKAVPSFATNYLGPDRILHMVRQKTLPDELLAAAAVSDDMRNSSGAQLVVSPDALTSGRGGRRGGEHMDERSSDDDEYGREHGAAQYDGWEEEVAAIADGKYRASRTVVVKETSASERQCRLLVGIPWLTRDTLVLRVSFPLHYPAFPADYIFETASNGSTAYGQLESVHERLMDSAESYAIRDAGSLDHCLHLLLMHLVQAVRLRSPYTRNRHLRMEDIDRLPPPPPPPPPLPMTHVRRRRLSRRHVMADGTRRWSGSSLGPGDRHWATASAWSEDGMSLDSRGSRSAEAEEDDVGNNAGEYDDEMYSGEEETNDDGLFADYRRLGAPAAATAEGLDGLSKTLRHANARDRLDSSTPFPRLCGGTFSGAGVLVCFFASIYTRDTYPGDDAWDRNRREMDQQLRALSKPRGLDKLSYYTRMVRFGLEHRGTYLPPDDGSTTARDEDAPRYYFRPNAAGRAASPGSGDGAAFFSQATRSETASGVGNSVVMCAAPEDRTASAELARQLVVEGPTPAWVCGHNAAVYALAGDDRMAAVWALVACLVDQNQYRRDQWAAHRPVLTWLATVMMRLERRGEAQTLALLACVVGPVVVDESASMASAEEESYAAHGGGIERMVLDEEEEVAMHGDAVLPRIEDSGEIERMMAEGMYGDAESLSATPATSTPASPGPRSSAPTTAVSPTENSDDGNIWRRLRSNVLGRVQPPTKQAAETSDAATSAATASASADTNTKATAAAVPTRPRRRPIDTAAGLLGGTGAAHAQASYERSKRLFERRHTRMVMHRDQQPTIPADVRLQAAYLDHWKLVYARVLYRWGMDAKAAEVVGCVVDPALRKLLRNMYSQPGPSPVVRRRLACAWCGEIVRGRALVCHACGHGGHKAHMLKWFGSAQARLAQLVDHQPADASPSPCVHSVLLPHGALDSDSSDSDGDSDGGAVVVAMPDGAPTCPAGCGCCCLLESRKLFVQ